MSFLKRPTGNSIAQFFVIMTDGNGVAGTTFERRLTEIAPAGD